MNGSLTIKISTVTGFHEESWQPAWGIRTALVGLSVSSCTLFYSMLNPTSSADSLVSLSHDQMYNLPQSFFTTEAKGAIGGLDAPASERKRLAAL